MRKKKSRGEQLFEWVESVLAGKAMEVTVASEDASFRRYFRIHSGGKTWIAMDAPPEKENNESFIAVSEAFQHMELNVPEVYVQDLNRGFLFITDLGSKCYLDELNETNVDQLYDDAMSALLKLQTGERPYNVKLPAYDETLLRQEMDLFSDWFLEKHVKLTLSESEDAGLKQVHDVLTESALAQDKVWVHRDYHSRNLMVTEKNNPGILDFQDAVEGPITYDLVSLLRDCYITWPTDKVESWVKQYLSELQKHYLCDGVSEEAFIKWFDLMGVQRHLKAIGIFSRLNYRDEKSTYLGDIPRTLAYVKDVSAKYDELEALHQLIVSRILPSLEDEQ